MLHKISKLKGFHIVATDGECGHVDEFLVDERSKMCFLVVDTSNWIGGKSVLISQTDVEAIDAPKGQIRIRLTRHEIAHGPAEDSADIELIETLPPAII